MSIPLCSHTLGQTGTSYILSNTRTARGSYTFDDPPPVECETTPAQEGCHGDFDDSNWCNPQNLSVLFDGWGGVDAATGVDFSVLNKIHNLYLVSAGTWQTIVSIWMPEKSEFFCLTITAAPEVIAAFPDPTAVRLNIFLGGLDSDIGMQLQGNTPSRGDDIYFCVDFLGLKAEGFFGDAPGTLTRGTAEVTNNEPYPCSPLTCSNFHNFTALLRPYPIRWNLTMTGYVGPADGSCTCYDQPGTCAGYIVNDFTLVQDDGDVITGDSKIEIHPRYRGGAGTRQLNKCTLQCFCNYWTVDSNIRETMVYQTNDSTGTLFPNLCLVIDTYCDHAQNVVFSYLALGTGFGGDWAFRAINILACTFNGFPTRPDPLGFPNPYNLRDEFTFQGGEPKPDANDPSYFQARIRNRADMIRPRILTQRVINKQAFPPQGSITPDPIVDEARPETCCYASLLLEPVF